MQQLVDICTPFNQATIIQKNLKDQVLAAINPAKEFAHEIE